MKILLIILLFIFSYIFPMFGGDTYISGSGKTFHEASNAAINAANAVGVTKTSGQMTVKSGDTYTSIITVPAVTPVTRSTNTFVPNNKATVY